MATGLLSYIDERQDRARTRAMEEQLAQQVEGMDWSATMPMQGMGAFGYGGGGGLGAASNAIAGLESGGRYDALGPVTDSGDRAFGKYQVMGANIPSWTEEALGTAMTPDQFLASPEAQEAVFAFKFGGYMQQYGTFEDAASAWHSGRPLSQISDRTSDGYMSTRDYVDRAAGTYYGQGQSPASGGGMQINPDGSIGVQASPGYAPGAQTPFGAPGAIPNTEWMPDPRMPSQFMQLVPTLLRGGHLDDAMNLMTPMQRYALDSNIMRSQYGINSTLQQEVYQQQRALNDQKAAQARALAQYEAQLRAQTAAPVFTPELRQQVVDMDTRLGNAETVYDWFTETGAMDRTVSPSDRAYYGSIWATTTLPYMQQLFEAGAMQKEELALFQELAGNPDAWAKLTDKNKRTMEAVIDLMRQDRAKWFAVNPGLLDPGQRYGVPLTERPAGVTPVSADEARGTVGAALREVKRGDQSGYVIPQAEEDLRRLQADTEAWLNSRGAN